MLSLLPEPRIQFFDANGDPLDGGWLYTCVPGGTINQGKTTYKDANAVTPNANPIELESDGRCTCFLNGIYKIYLQDANHVDVYNVDNVSAAPFLANVTVQWNIYNAIPTFVNGVSFSLPGNVAADFPIGLRIKSINTGGTIYSTVSSVAVATDTTITVINDSGALDSGLTAIYTGIITPTSNALPIVPIALKNGSFVYDISDLNKFLVGNSASPMNFTLITTPPSGSWSRVHNSGTAAITFIGPLYGLVDSILEAGADVTMFFDGTSWWALYSDSAHGIFTTDLTVVDSDTFVVDASGLKYGGGGTFPEFTVDPNGNIIFGGDLSTYGLFRGATEIVLIDSSDFINFLTRAYVAQDPVDPLEIATKQYVDNNLSAGFALGSCIRLVPIAYGPFTFEAYTNLTEWHDDSVAALSGYRTVGISGTPNNPNGLFSNVYVTADCNAYFHFFGIYFKNANAGNIGFRIGYATSPAASNTPIGSTASPVFPAGHQPSPSSFSSTVLYADPGGGGTAYRWWDHAVIGPIALTPGWYSIFVQIYSNTGLAIGPFAIVGGLYLTLSAS